VATVRLAQGEEAVFAIEYERTLKSEQKYAKILEAIEREERLHTILYLAPSYEILSSLRWYIERARLSIVFAMVDDFKRDVLDAQVDLAGTYRRMTLAEALARGVAEKKSRAYA
jgi:hypothetical protein